LWKAYGQSKTANILFAVELDRRGAADGIRAFSVHPGGIVGTGLDRHVPREGLKAAGVIDEHGRPVIDPARDLKTVAQGAATQVWCATSPQLTGMGGVYCENCDVASLRPPAPPKSHAVADSLGQHGVWPYAVDADAARRLWALGETLTGVGIDASRP
jgi:NAD(P)-dependent dehydrogenase (short-subunit alcohol dehydrogenase family)